MNNKKNFSLTWIIFILILIYGSALRGVEVFNKNYLFGFDQGRDYLAVSQIIDEHKLTLIGAEVGAGFAGINGLFHGPFYYYLLTIPYILFHGDPYGSILLMFMIAVLALFLSFFLFGKIFGNAMGLLNAFLFAISRPFEADARFLWNSHPAPVFIIIALFFAYKIPRKPKLFFGLSLFTAGFIYNFQTAIAVPLVISIFLYVLIVLRVKDVKAYVTAIGLLLLSFSPLIFFQMRHDYMAFRGLASYIREGGGGSIINGVSVSQHVRDYWNNFKNTFASDPPVVDLEVVFQMLLVFVLGVSLFYALREKEPARRGFIFLLYIVLVVSWCFFLLLRNVIWDYYILHLHIAFIILFSYGTLKLVETFRKRKTYAFVFFPLLYLAVMSYGSMNRFKDVWGYDFGDYGGGAKIKGKTDAIDYVYADAKGKPFNVLVFVPPIYTYPYDYLFQWYGKTKYNYVPKNEKKGLLYLIIEPDYDKPWTYKGWLETVVAGGDVIETKTLPSGLIVQKRQMNQ